MKRTLIAFSLTLFLSVGCASTRPADPTPQGQDRVPAATVATQDLDGFFTGAGQDPSMLVAMNESKMDAVRKAVVLLVGGEEKERLYRDILNVRIYSTSNPNQFVDTATFERLRRDKVGEDFIFEARMKLRIDVIRSALQASGVPVVGSPAPAVAATPVPGTAAQPSAPATGPATTDLDIRAGDYEGATEEEARTIRRLVDTMTYMVSYPENSPLDPAVLRTLVTAANQYLVANRVQLIDLSAVERVKEDQRRVFEDQTGTDLSLTQWVAQHLNADIYVEISAVITETTNTRGHFLARGSFDAKVFDPSTGRLLGNVSFNQPNAAMSPASIDLARTNLIQNTVTHELMPRVIEQARGFMAQKLQRGIRFEVVFQRTADSRLMSQFRRALQRRMKSVNVLSSSPEESKYELYFIGTAADLEEAVYRAAESVPGMEGIFNVMIRGRNLTFNTGL